MASKEFEVHALGGHNFPTWAMNIKVSLSRCELYACLSDSDMSTKSMIEKNKYEALYIIRNHIHPDLKSEYRMEENPCALWDNLKQHYEQQKAVVLPEASHEWSYLRLQDFKTVDEYNHVVHKVCQKL